MELHVDVRKRFGEFTLEADFAVEGDRIGIFGDSGSGKSTLAGLLAGLHAPDRGEIVLDGDRLYSSRDGINVPPDRRHIAIVFQQPSLFPHLNVRSNLLYGYRRRAAAHRSVGFDALVEALRLGPLLSRGVNHLSGGEKQRVALGRAVLASPRLLLMDEPLSALGDGHKFQIIPYLKDVSGRFRIPFLFISHSLVEMRLMTDRVLVVAGGRVAEQTTTEALARSRMGLSPVGYINLLRLSSPRRLDGLCAYRWGAGELLVSAGNETEGVFELSSKDIILFKKHPEATSARNLLRCTVANTFAAGTRIGVELACGDRSLVAEITHQAASDLEVAPGGELFAAIKASAFRRLG